MSYINTLTLQYPISFERLVALYPLIGFPPNEDFTPPSPHRRVVPSAPPACNPTLQAVVEAAPVLVGDTWTQAWKIVNSYATPEQEAAALADKKAVDEANFRLNAKRLRAELVSKIKVTTASGKVFDGNEDSQDRMTRRLLTLQRTGETAAVWVLADNTQAQVSAAELGEALALAVAAQDSVWVI
jgi:hypothetical protein